MAKFFKRALIYPYNQRPIVHDEFFAQITKYYIYGKSWLAINKNKTYLLECELEKNIFSFGKRHFKNNFVEANRKNTNLKLYTSFLFE